MQRIFAAALSFYAVAAPALAQEVLVDEEYRFRLTAPGDDWRLLDEETIAGVVPDALAGLTRGNFFGVVIVEQAPGADPEAMARLILDGMPIADPDVEQFAKLEFQGRPAARYLVRGEIDGFDLRFWNTVFENGGYVYQVVAWGPAEEVGPEAKPLEPVARAFTLLEGEVVGRAASRTVTDATGVGWSVGDGVFRSVVYGLRVEPAEPWRLAVGVELSSMASDAEVGLVSQSPEAYAVVICEAIAGVEPEAYVERCRASFAEGLEPLEDSFSASIDGIAFELTPYRAIDGVALVLMHGAFVRDGICYQVQTWSLAALDEAARELLPSAFGSIRFLGAEERALHAAELAALPDPQNVVRERHSLRQGVYRDFEYGLTWTKPPGHWRVTCADEGVELDENLRLYLEEAALGVFGELLVVPAGDAPLADAHADAVWGYWEGDEDEPPAARAVTLGDVPALATSFEVGAGVDRYGFRIVTAVHSGRIYTLELYGLAENVARAGAALDAATAALAILSDPLEPEVHDPDVHRDLRVGFELRSPGPGWRAERNLIPAQVAQFGGACNWRDRSGGEVFAVAVCALGPGQDQATLEQLILDRLGRGVRGRPTESEAVFDGFPCRRRTFTRLLGRTEVVVFRRANTLYVVGASSRRGDSSALADAERLFTLLD